MLFGDTAVNAGSYESAGATNAKTISNAGQFTHTGAISIGTLFENTGGTADLAGPTSWTGGARLVATGGNVILRHDAGALSGPTLRMDADGGVIELKTGQQLARLNVGAGKVALEPGGGKVLQAKAYSAQESEGTFAGQLDLGDGITILEYAQTSPAEVVRRQLESG